MGLQKPAKGNKLNYNGDKIQIYGRGKYQCQHYSNNFYSLLILFVITIIIVIIIASMKGLC